MNLADLNKVAQAMVAPGKGILAADETSGTIKKRFDAIRVENTEKTRRDYREMLFRSKEAMTNTSRASSSMTKPSGRTRKDGTPLVKLIEQPAPSPASRSMREPRRCRTSRANWSPPGSTSSPSA